MCTTSEDKFRTDCLEIFTEISKIDEKLHCLQYPSTDHKLPEVERNVEIAHQHLEDAQNRIHKVNDILDW